MATIGPGDFALTMSELRVVARFAVESAEDVLSVFETHHPGDRRPRRRFLDVLRGYPPAPTGRNRVAELMTVLDVSLRAT